MKSIDKRGTSPVKLRALSPEDLKKDLMNLKKEQFNLRFQSASGQMEKTSRVREVRRDIARIQTILRQKAQA